MLVRSRAQWHEEGERNSKYFLSLEKRNACTKKIQYIEANDKIVTSTSEILSLFTETLRNKYSNQKDVDSVDRQDIANNLSSTLTEKERKELVVELILRRAYYRY